MRPGKLLIIPSIFFFSGFSFATTQPLVTIGELEAQQNRNILLQAKVQWICPYISRHLLSLNPLQARCRRYSRGER
ncbi:outer membrane pore protein [Shigella sonnei]|nr:outer membrane pore protein [Shigella sonnei]CTP63421.1 outer membrane pore protein [Shigella sonnei]